HGERRKRDCRVECPVGPAAEVTERRVASAPRRGGTEPVCDCVRAFAHVPPRSPSRSLPPPSPHWPIPPTGTVPAASSARGSPPTRCPRCRTMHPRSEEHTSELQSRFELV